MQLVKFNLIAIYCVHLLDVGNHLNQSINQIKGKVYNCVSVGGCSVCHYPVESIQSMQQFCQEMFQL